MAFVIRSSCFVMFWLPYQLTGVLSRRATDQRDVAATATVFVGAGVYAGWLALLALAAWAVRGAGAAILTAGLLPPLAVAGLFAVEHVMSVAGAVRTWVQLRRATHRSRATLRRERSGIAEFLEQAHQWVSAETRGQPDGQTPR